MQIKKATIEVRNPLLLAHAGAKQQVVGKKLNRTKYFLPEQHLLMVVGNYGSGKTEVSVNLAIQLASQGHKVQIADLDIVNPYFRCREAQDLMRQHQIEVIIPPGSQSFADLPILVPQIQGMIDPAAQGYRIFDVGGDDVGARLLSSLAPRIERLAGTGNQPGDCPYALWQVINARRPFTTTVEGCLQMMDSIERASRLRVTGLISNTHLVTQTTPEVIVEGVELAQKVSEASSRPLVFTSVMEDLADSEQLIGLETEILRLSRHMLPPWLRKQGEENNLPASRSVPIGRPPGVE